MTASTDVVAAIEAFEYRYATERQLHDGLTLAFSAAGLEAIPEVPLGPAGRIDFMVETIGVEVKVTGEAEPLLRQITRYAHRDEISELVVVTNRHKHRVLPPTVAGKPVTVVVVGGP